MGIAESGDSSDGLFDLRWWFADLIYGGSLGTMAELLPPYKESGGLLIGLLIDCDDLSLFLYIIFFTRVHLVKMGSSYFILFSFSFHFR